MIRNQTMTTKRRENRAFSWFRWTESSYSLSAASEAIPSPKVKMLSRFFQGTWKLAQCHLGDQYVKNSFCILLNKKSYFCAYREDILFILSRALDNTGVEQHLSHCKHSEEEQQLKRKQVLYPGKYFSGTFGHFHLLIFLQVSILNACVW